MNTQDIREQLRAIVTRNGKSGRIPELLEDELNKLVALIDFQILQARIDELELHHKWAWKVGEGKHYEQRKAELETLTKQQEGR
jgi:hypothetical protein